MGQHPEIHHPLGDRSADEAAKTQIGITNIAGKNGSAQAAAHHGGHGQQVIDAMTDAGRGIVAVDEHPVIGLVLPADPIKVLAVLPVFAKLSQASSTVDAQSDFDQAATDKRIRRFAGDANSDVRFASIQAEMLERAPE